MRDCNKCLHHISGSCSAWECEMQTLEDYRNKVIDEFSERLHLKITAEIDDCADELEWIEEIAEQMKKGEEYGRFDK